MFTPLKIHFENAERFLIVSHSRPDPDTIGAGCGLRAGLESVGKIVRHVCVDTISETLLHLHRAEDIETSAESLRAQDGEVVIVVDVSDLQLIAAQTDWSRHVVINIDHHLTNKLYGTVNIIDPQASSASEMIMKVFQFFGWNMTSEVASVLLAGMLFDTGGLSNRATNASALESVAYLMSTGAHYHEIMSHMGGQVTVAKMKLWGRAFQRMSYDITSGVASTCIRLDDYLTSGLPDRIGEEGLANYLNALHDADIVCVWKEEENGSVKASLRTTRDHVSVADIAKQFNGGGHHKAAGFTTQGTIQVKESGEWQVCQLDGTSHPFYALPRKYFEQKV